MKRAGSAEEVANAIVWLLSPEASYVTGTVARRDRRSLMATPTMDLIKPLITLLAIVNPLAIVPFFIHYTQGCHASSSASARPGCPLVQRVRRDRGRARCSGCTSCRVLRHLASRASRSAAACCC